MKKNMTIQLKYFILFMFMLFSITQVNADTISSINGPETIQTGQTITVNIDYETEDKELSFALQGANDPWDNYFAKRIKSDENGHQITFTVPNIPEGTPLMYQAYLTPKGKSWTDRVAVKWQSGVSLDTGNGAAPNNPIDLVLTPERTSVHLSWRDQSDNESGFKIFRDKEYITTLPKNTTQYTDRGLQPHTTYNYTVKATNDETSFILGVNIGSTRSVTIDEHRWLAEDVAEENGMLISSAQALSKTSTDIQPTPAVDTDMHTMLNSVRWANKDWNIKQPIPNGTYSVSIWIMENYKSHNRKIDISVEGQTKHAIGSLAKGEWKKYTYSNVTVNDGTLDILLHGDSDVHMMGFEVLGQKSTRQDHWKLVVDGRMLKHADGTGFFWMGDTAWNMAYKLNREEVKTYLTNRKKHGFNVIQMKAISGAWHKANREGERPFNDWRLGGDPKTAEIKYNEPNEVYWKHIDFIIDEAAKRGMYIALLPAWNGTYNNTGEAQIYGTFIANRYKNTKNIIWVNGGDSNSQNSNKKAIWDEMGRTIDAIVGDKQLISYHPSGLASSTMWFNNTQWLDFHMIQSGHSASIEQANNLMTAGYNKDTRPILDGEPKYEEIHKDMNDTKPAYGAKDVREIAYIQLFSGAFGHTYGNNAIWQFWKKGTPACCSTPKNSWDIALNDLGAKQMKFVTKLMKSRPILNREPKQSLIANSSNNDAIATKGDGYAMVYLPKGGSVTVHLNQIASNVKAWWYNPRNGVSSDIGTFQTATQSFDTHSDDDMVLVLDDVGRKFAAPGKVTWENQ